jgi:hypothetical protein
MIGELERSLQPAGGEASCYRPCRARLVRVCDQAGRQTIQSSVEGVGGT